MGRQRKPWSCSKEELGEQLRLLGFYRHHPEAVNDSYMILANSNPLGTPRGRYDEHNSKFSISIKPRFNRSSRRSESLLKVLLADFSNGVRKVLLAVDVANSNLEPAHNTTKILCPNDSVRVSISLVC